MAPLAGIVAKLPAGNRRAKSLQGLSVFVRVVWEDESGSCAEYEDVAAWFSQHVVDWLDDHQPRLLTVEIAVRWGLVDDDGLSVQYTNDNSKPYQVASVLLASGEVNGWEKGKYYVSNRVYGSPYSFWKAPFFTISSFQCSTDDEHQYVPYNVQKHRDRTITVHVPPASKAAFLRHVDEWCLEHVGQPYDLTASGARAPSEKSEKSGLLTVDPIYCKTSEGHCAVASIVNMLYMEEGPTVALALLDQPAPKPGRKIGSFNPWLEGALAAVRKQHQLSCTYSLCCLREHEHAPWLFEPTDFIASAKEGKFIVRLAGLDDDTEDVDHTVYVDADRQLIFDCMEKRAIKLCYRGLECCVGDAFLIGVSDIRVVTPTKLGVGNRKPRRKKRTTEDS